jgi:hypothetical protein
MFERLHPGCVICASEDSPRRRCESRLCNDCARDCAEFNLVKPDGDDTKCGQASVCLEAVGLSKEAQP